MHLLHLFLPLTLTLAHHTSSTDPPSLSPVFHLTDITYESHVVYSTPAHLAVSYAKLAFDLHNSEAYTSHCSGTSDGKLGGAYFSWPVSTLCEGDTQGTGEASFVYLGYSSLLTVNETWVAGGHRYYGSGNVTLNLACETKLWKNPNYTWPNQGDLYRTEDVKCAPINVSFEPEVVQLD